MNIGPSLNQWHSTSSRAYLEKILKESPVIEILLTEEYKIPKKIKDLIEKGVKIPDTRLHIYTKTKDGKIFNLDEKKFENVLDFVGEHTKVKAVITHPFQKKTLEKHFENYIDQLNSITQQRDIHIELENGAPLGSTITGLSGESCQSPEEHYKYTRSLHEKFDENVWMVCDLGKYAEHFYYTGTPLKEVSSKIMGSIKKNSSLIKGIHVCEKSWTIDEGDKFRTKGLVYGGLIGAINILKEVQRLPNSNDIDISVETNEKMKDMYESLKYAQKRVL